MFDSSHLFIATESLTALSVNSINLTHPAELIKHAGWTLYRKENKKNVSGSHPLDCEDASLNLDEERE